MYNITIDARMLNNSGIGTYLKRILPIIINKCPEYKFNLMGNRVELESFNFHNYDNVKILSTDCSIYSISEQVEIPKLIPKKSDILWVPHYNIPVFYRGKLVVTVHDVFHLAMPQYVEGSMKKIYSKYMFNAVKNKADRIITVSNFTMNEFQKLVGVSKTPISTIYNGVDASWRAIETDEIKLQKPYIIYVGNVKPHKNLKKLLKAFNSIKDSITHDLLIVGKKDGFITKDLEVMTYAKSMGDRVKFTGFIEDSKLRQYVKNATAMVFPSLYEGFGLPPLEAMACGCPVISSEAASLPEICKDAVLYINPNDETDIAKKIKLLLDNDKLRSSLIQKGLIRSEDFSWEISAEETIHLIREVLLK